MTPDQRMQLQIARTQQYGDIMRTTIGGLIAIAAIIGFGAQGVDIALFFAIIATSLFGILGGGTALDDISILRDDMNEDTAASHYGRQAKSRDLGLLKLISGVLIGLAGLAEIAALFWM